MKTINFITFFTIVFTIYGLANYYIFIRCWQAIPQNSRWRILYLVVFIFLALSYIIGRILEKIWLSTLSDIFVWIGSFWLAAFFYFLLIVVILDLARLFNHYLHFIPLITQNYQKAKQITILISIGIVFITIILGHINAITPRIRTLNLSIKKKANLNKINIVVASDIHLGTIIGRKRFCKIVDKINELKPDLVLLPGDIVDEDLAPVIRENLGDALKHIKSKFGVYAITGNHEYIGGVEMATKYLEEHGIIVLRDGVININDSVYLVGREDRSIKQFTGKQRKSLADLMGQIEKNYPLILMDHQPFQLEEVEQNGIDLQLSGHTHHGQLWPINFITKAIYEKSWGYLKKGKTHIYISSGVGTWGPPVRTGNRPEIINMILNFKSQNQND